MMERSVEESEHTGPLLIEKTRPRITYWLKRVTQTMQRRSQTSIWEVAPQFSTFTGVTLKRQTRSE